MKIVIAGASGFVGKAVVDRLRPHYDVVALSRSSDQGPFKDQSGNTLIWKKCDLFSLLETENAVEGADIGIYLVHSMKPSARLSQGSFDDFDLIVADNFMRAAEKHGLKQIIYLSGIVPDQLSKNGTFSRHLKSRLEVEQTFQARKVPVTVLRCAMILGGEGSSFQVMVRLVERLPFLICPPWVGTLSQPIALRDAVTAIQHCVNNNNSFNKVYDVAGPEVLSYRNMMERVAKILNKKRWFINFNWITPGLSRVWVTAITGAPKSLIQPLINSLKCEMLARKDHLLQVPGFKFLNFEEAFQLALQRYNSNEPPRAFVSSLKDSKLVRSVQRLPLPRGWTAENVAKAYMKWLPVLMPWLIRVSVNDGWVRFSLRWFKLDLLILQYSPERSSDDRQLFYIRGGFLVSKSSKGRLEFRETLNKTALIAAIHNYEPSLAWFIYRWSQALVHLLVMHKFKVYLSQQNK